MLTLWLFWLLLVISHDFFQRRVPNWLVSLGAVTALAALISGNQPFGSSWLSAILASITFLIAFASMYVLRLMGAGDVKFAAALALWIGIQPMFIVWLGASLLAGVHAVIFFGLRRWPVSDRLFAAFSAVNSNNMGEKRIKNTPYAAYMAITSVVWAMFLR